MSKETEPTPEERYDKHLQANGFLRGYINNKQQTISYSKELDCWCVTHEGRILATKGSLDRLLGWLDLYNETNNET